VSSEAVASTRKKTFSSNAGRRWRSPRPRRRQPGLLQQMCAEPRSWGGHRCLGAAGAVRMNIEPVGEAGAVRQPRSGGSEGSWLTDPPLRCRRDLRRLPQGSRKIFRSLAGNGDLQGPAVGKPDCYSRCVQSRGLGMNIEAGGDAGAVRMNIGPVGEAGAVRQPRSDGSESSWLTDPPSSLPS